MLILDTKSVQNMLHMSVGILVNKINIIEEMGKT